MVSLNKLIKRENDELYTPKILVECIKPFFDSWLNNFNGIPKVWCPFDLDQSEFVLFFQEYERQNKIELVYSHILDLDGNGDFFQRLSNQDFDIVISNPPFSRKLDIFKALNSMKKPWALIMNLECLNYQEIGEYFTTNPIGLIIPDKKVSFDGNTSAFNSSYICSESFYKGVTFVHLENNNSNKNFVPSRMISKMETSETNKEVGFNWKMKK